MKDSSFINKPPMREIVGAISRNKPRENGPHEKKGKTVLVRVHGKPELGAVRAVKEGPRGAPNLLVETVPAYGAKPVLLTVAHRKAQETSGMPADLAKRMARGAKEKK